MPFHNVTEAARALHLAQPSVSTQLAKLEKALGMTLFACTTLS
ncbi:helix-turn-helix domain-containing protein [Pseudomonas sp.]